MNLTGKTIAVCVCGGIAAYKACEIVSRLKKLGAQVFVVMTKNATEFVTPLTFETLSNNKVICDMFDREREWNVEHISLAKRADLFLVVPATANIIGKTANGIADDFMSTTIMAVAAGKVVFAPAMNTGMLESAAYRANEQLLLDRGYHFIASESGELACGDSGRGRLASVDAVVDRVVELLKPVQDFAGKRALVTAGGTREAIDPVRFLGNNSSGLMGVELANEAYERGAEVVLVVGNIRADVEKRIMKGIKVVKAATTDEMYKVVKAIATDEMYNAVAFEENMKEGKLFVGTGVLDRQCCDHNLSNERTPASAPIVSSRAKPRDLHNIDYYIFAAAPCDYKVAYSPNKIKEKETTLKLTKSIDIAQEIGKTKQNAKTIIFAAESENLIENAKAKMKIKNADMVIANDITQDGAGFDCDTNIITVITKKETKPMEKAGKKNLAKIILNQVCLL